MSDEETGKVWFWFRFWFFWFFPPFWFVVRVMVGTWWDVGVVVGSGCVVILVYLREWFPH